MKAPVHGGRVYEAAARLGRPWQSIVDFSANINPLGQPQGLKEAVFADFERTLHYPEIRAESLALALAEQAGLPPECVLPGAGSSPQLYLIGRSIQAPRPFIIGPAFAEYEAALNCAGYQPGYVLTREEDDWLVTRETLAALFDQWPGLVFLAHPANPTGRLLPFDILSELAEECHKRGIWLVVDEAFIDFTENGRSLIALTPHQPRLIVLRSLTKIFALPGLRLAFLAAHPETLARLAGQVEPWALSSLAISAGHFCLQQKKFRTKTVGATARARAYLVENLEALNFCKIFPSEANYVLIKLNKPDHRDYLAALFQEGILVRDAANFRGLGPGFLRLAVRPTAEIDILAQATRRYLERKNA